MATWQPDDRWDPGNPENRARTRQLQSALRERLIGWDPIGVGDAPEAADEYDSYVSPLMHLLHGGASVDVVNDYLTHLVRDWFGTAPHPEREHQFAESLVAWWRAETGA